MKNLFKYIIPVFLVAFGILALSDKAEFFSCGEVCGTLSVISSDDCTVYAEQANNFFLPSNNCIASGMSARQGVSKRSNSLSKHVSKRSNPFSRNGGWDVCLTKRICVYAAGFSHYRFSFILSSVTIPAVKLIVLGKLLI